MSNVKQYRKKPVVIQAMHYDGSPDNGQDVCNWLLANGVNPQYNLNYTMIDIPTLEGAMQVTKGDYIIKGVAGEFYPCKPDIFLQSYEQVNDLANMNLDTKRMLLKSAPSDPKRKANT